MMLRIPDGVNLASGKKYYTCRLCGAAYNEVEIPFTSGVTVPVIPVRDDDGEITTVGETLTGVTSGDTAIVDNVKLISGAWDGSAAGIVWCTSPTGLDFDTGHWGYIHPTTGVGEAVTGAAGAARFTLAEYGNKKSYGRYYPEDEIVERDGTYLCLAHNSARWNFKDKNDQIIDIDEGDREG